MALKANPQWSLATHLIFQQGSSSLYTVLEESSQRRKCLPATQTRTSNCISLKDGRGIGGLRGFKETLLAGKMKTNITSTAADRNLKIQAFLVPVVFHKPAVFLQPVGSKGFYQTGSWPQGAKAQLSVGCRVRELNPTCYWGSNSGKSCKYPRPLCSPPPGKPAHFCPLTQFLGWIFFPFRALCCAYLPETNRHERTLMRPRRRKVSLKYPSKAAVKPQSCSCSHLLLIFMSMWNNVYYRLISINARDSGYF